MPGAGRARYHGAMDRPVLRPAVEGDRDAIAALWHASASLLSVGVPAMPSAAELRRRLDAECARGWEVTVAGTAGGIAGFLALRPEDGVLDQLFLRPDCLGRGIGSLLLAHAKARMPTGFTLFTRPVNRPAIRFYERHGLAFLRDEVHPHFGDPIRVYGWRGT